MGTRNTTTFFCDRCSASTPHKGAVEISLEADSGPEWTTEVDLCSSCLQDLKSKILNHINKTVP